MPCLGCEVIIRKLYWLYCSIVTRHVIHYVICCNVIIEPYHLYVYIAVLLHVMIHVAWCNAIIKLYRLHCSTVTRHVTCYVQ